MSRFSEAAAKRTTLSEVMANKTRVDTDQIINHYPGGVTLIDFDIMTGDKGPYPVFAINEDPGVCFFGGVVLYNIVSEWVTLCDGSIEAARDELKSSGGVKVKLARGKTKAGNNCTTVTVI